MKKNEQPVGVRCTDSLPCCALKFFFMHTYSVLLCCCAIIFSSCTLTMLCFNNFFFTRTYSVPCYALIFSFALTLLRLNFFFMHTLPCCALIFFRAHLPCCALFFFSCALTLL